MTAASSKKFTFRFIVVSSAPQRGGVWRTWEPGTVSRSSRMDSGVSGNATPWGRTSV